MAKKVRCEICDRSFKDIESLVQHNAAKHSSSLNKKQEIKKINIKGKIIGVIILIIIIAFIIWTISGAISELRSCKTASAIEINIGGHTNLALHIHQDLKIVIDGKQQIIPANIGIAPNIMRPIHTHDKPGELHVEGPCKRDFNLGEFFKIWGREFNSQCIFDKCTDNGELKMYVNSLPNNEFENLILKDDDSILIEYKSIA